MLIAFISLQGGRTHPWFSHCTPLCAAAQPQSPSNSQHGADEPPACSKASNPILPQQCQEQLAHRPAPSPARQDAAAHAGTAPISPSIRGNTWTRDRGCQEGLKEVGGQQRFRKRLCSLSRNMTKALISLWLTITLKLFLSTPVPAWPGHQHIRRHRGAGGTHHTGLNPALPLGIT